MTPLGVMRFLRLAPTSGVCDGKYTVITVFPFFPPGSLFFGMAVSSWVRRPALLNPLSQHVPWAVGPSAWLTNAVIPLQKGPRPPFEPVVIVTFLLLDLPPVQIRTFLTVTPIFLRLSFYIVFQYSFRLVPLAFPRFGLGQAFVQWPEVAGGFFSVFFPPFLLFYL